MSRNGRWLLESVTVRGVLAFPSEVTFRFQPGGQVLEAPNHSGKTSLTLALLWALTGQVPALPRISKQSFRLFNRQTGDKSSCSVAVVLRDGEREMVIRREYQARAKEGDGLEVEVGSAALAGEEAQRRIQSELGVSVGSLEGCGVVLQDFRLKLITEPDSAVGAVVNEMLGLGTLSEVVPALRERAADAERASKEMQAFLSGGDPLARWEEEGRRLAGDLEKRESQALDAGYAAADLEQPAVRTAEELRAVREALGLTVPGEVTSADHEIEALRREVAKQRQGSPDHVALAAIQGKISALQPLLRELGVVAEAWEQHHAALTAEAESGQMDREEVSVARTKLETLLAENADRRSALAEEQGFLTAAYSHLQAHVDVDKCPVCGNRVPLAKLREDVGKRISAKLAAELDRLQAIDDQARRGKRQLDARLKRLSELHAEHESLIARARTTAEHPTARAVGTPFAKPEVLWTSAKQRDRALAALREALDALEAERATLKSKAENLQARQARREAEHFYPLEQALNRARERLLPLVEAAERLEGHETGRAGAEQRSNDLRALLEEAQDLSTRLKRIAKVVWEVELETATAAVKRRLPFISKFFADVAQNPAYTGLEMEADISREAVRYRLMAVSSLSASLADAVGHVLSGGDLSAASVALLVGLASGDAHRLGFLVLDDPAEQMDEHLQERLAKELATTLPDRQVIVLTHQPDFARALIHHGMKPGKLAAAAVPT